MNPRFGLLLLVACGPVGSQWVQQRSSSGATSDPISFEPRGEAQSLPEALPAMSKLRTAPQAPRQAPPARATEVAAAPDKLSAARSPAPRSPTPPTAASPGRALGVFRNTYYNFPSEADHSGPKVTVYNAQCKAIAEVPQSFHDTLCVQGSGRLSRGQTVSFARRDCACARTCPRTDQKICYQALSPEKFQWGRGAMGTAIVPLFTLAVDSELIPLGSAVFIPDYVGFPLNAAGTETHDGCFLAADRGIRVKGKHIDVFAGTEAMTRVYNKRLPSNRGVTVFLDSPLCSAE